METSEGQKTTSLAGKVLIFQTVVIEACGGQENGDLSGARNCIEQQGLTTGICMEGIYIRPTVESDKPLIKRVMEQTEMPVMQRAFPEFMDRVVNSYFDDLPLVARTIVLQGNGTFCGYCNLRREKEPGLEIGIELLEEYRGHGYGPEALRQLIAEQEGRHGIDWYRAVVEPDNDASIGMFRKLNARPDGLRRSPYLREDKDAERFKRNHPELITDGMRRTAKWFGVEPVDLLAERLLFRVSSHPSELFPCR